MNPKPLTILLATAVAACSQSTTSAPTSDGSAIDAGASAGGGTDAGAANADDAGPGPTVGDAGPTVGDAGPGPTVGDAGPGPSSSPDAGVAPPPALAVGYTTQTFNSTTLGTTPGTWQDYTFFGISQPAGGTVQNADGSLSLPGLCGDNFGANVATAAANASKPQGWQGVAFGGGGYFEATLSFTGTPDGTDTGGIGFWAGDVEHASGFLPQTPGQNWVEIDCLETDVASDHQWGNAFHNWYNAGGPNAGVNPPAIVNPVSIPNGGTFAGSHTYAFLWVPATSTTQGYMKFFADGVQINGTVFWNLYDASQPFPPSGANIGNVIDTLHLYLILGNDSTSYPGSVTSVQVWQRSAAGNVTF